MKKNRLKWHRNRLDNFRILRCIPKTYHQLMKYLYPQMGKATLLCSQGPCILWTKSGHEVALHLCRGCDFHNTLWCFSGLKCVWTVQMVRKTCALKKFPLVLTTIMPVLRDTEPSLREWGASSAWHMLCLPSWRIIFIFKLLFLIFKVCNALTASISHLKNSKKLLWHCLAHWDCLQTLV